MKKRLTVILSLIMAFVLCLSLVACGGDKGKPNGPGPNDSGKAVSISLNDAIDAIDGVLNAKGFTGKASYTASTKNTEAVTDSVSFDKRGNKIKLTAGTNESIVDIATGYVYIKGDNGYTFDNNFYANAVGYVQYLLSSLKQEGAQKNIEARYNEKTKTVTFVVERAESYNKYLEPIQSAYKDDEKTLGELLDEYCYMLSGKNFDAVYKTVEAFVNDKKNTVGALFNELGKIGVDVEAILEMAGLELDAGMLTAIKARTLGQVVVGAYNYIMSSFGGLLPTADDADEDPVQGDILGGMQSFGMGLLQAMLFDEVSDTAVTDGLQGIKTLVGVAQLFDVKTTIDLALKDNAGLADLYTVIKDDVKLKNATVTVTLKVDDDKNIMGIKVDNLVAHTYTGKAAEGSFLADNDYLATAEIAIDEYKTATEDFVINIDPACDYKMDVTAFVYKVTDNDVSVYYETAGKTVNVSSYVLEWITPSGEIREIQPEDENAFRFDATTSSFVFDNDLIDVFGDRMLASYLNAGYSACGTSLRATVFFDDDDYGYAISLMYVDDDWAAIYDYMYKTAMDKVLEFIGGAGSDAPNIGSGLIK